jgi:hypothetical protein
MKAIALSLYLLAALLIFSGCQSPVVMDYDLAELERMQSYTSFKIDTRAERENYGSVALSPLVDRRITSAIQNNLAAKGYGSADKADFRINFHTLTKDQTEVHDLGYGPAPFGREPYFGDYSYGRLFIDKYEEGTLVIDVIDIATNRLVWRGAHTRRLERRALNAVEAQTVVDAILLNFPPLLNGIPD